MTTPATQEEKKPLSPAELLEGLKGALFTVTDKYMARGLDMARLKMAANRCRFERNPGQAEQCSRDAKAAEKDVDALLLQMRSMEQTIAILSVLEHPDFWRIVREYTGEGFIFGAVTKQAHEPADIPWGESPIAALLKVQLALKPQEGALPRKEHTNG